MYEPMYLQVILPPEWLITHITAKWLLPIMYALMRLQTNLLSE
jgi:hypothetical protein